MPEFDGNAEHTALTSEPEIMLAAAREAGSLALSFFNRDPQVWHKGDRSPVTEADLAVDKLLKARLASTFTGYGWLSEETDDNHERLAATHLFIVDPIDGTRNFMRGGDQWTISMALAIHGEPVFGVVHNPVREEMITGQTGCGATVNGRPVSLGTPPEIDGMRVVGPGNVTARKNLSEVIPLSGEKISPLAYRIASVALGSVDGAVATKNAHDWDIAAADVILREAGGLLSDLDGEQPQYGKAVPKHPELVATHRSLSAEFRERVRDLF